MSQSKELLLAVINNAHSTPEERFAAQQQLYGSERQLQATIDREIESYLNFDRSLGVRLLVQHRQSLSPASRQAIDDFSNTQSFGMAPDAGTEERLNSLLDRTSSDLIKKEVIAALRVITWLREKGLPIHVTTAVV
jgi:hypothetical protein